MTVNCLRVGTCFVCAYVLLRSQSIDKAKELNEPRKDPWKQTRYNHLRVAAFHLLGLSSDAVRESDRLKIDGPIESVSRSVLAVVRQQEIAQKASSDEQQIFRDLELGRAQTALLRIDKYLRERSAEDSIARPPELPQKNRLDVPPYLMWEERAVALFAAGERDSAFREMEAAKSYLAGGSLTASFQGDLDYFNRQLGYMKFLSKDYAACKEAFSRVVFRKVRFFVGWNNDHLDDEFESECSSRLTSVHSR